MAYSELIKNVEKIRDYMREFYVYGFRSREEYTAKSARSYDNEKRRIDSWLGDYMFFRQDVGGKKIFLSVDSRAVPHNPFHRVFKAKSFTNNDIVLHFWLLDMLEEEDAVSFNEIMKCLWRDYINTFDTSFVLDESTLRKKLKEYEALGLIVSEKRGRALLYRRAKGIDDLDSWHDVVDFFSEENPLGVIGSYILDRYKCREELFRFKHHYVLYALDSEILLQLMVAIKEQRNITLILKGEDTESEREQDCHPLRVMISTQNGRQYLCAFHTQWGRIIFCRLDNIKEVLPKEVEANRECYEAEYQEISGKVWGVATGDGKTTEHVEMMIRVCKGEEYVINRLVREKRCGTVKRVDALHWLFSVDVLDAAEMLPWVRTFIGRIVEFRCNNQAVQERFLNDLRAVAMMYGSGDDAV